VKPILFVRNDEVETFGIAPKAFAEQGVETVVLEAPDPRAAWPELDQVGGVVMFGGSMNVDQVEDHPFLARDRDLARAAVERGTPYLGICLGAQLLARAMEHEVFRAPVREIGFEPVRPLAAVGHDPLLSHYEDGDRVFHWHEDTLELPDGAVQLVAGDRIPVQAFRVGELAWGVQFHFEIDREEIEAWLEDAGAAGGLEAKWGKSSERVREEADALLAEHEAKGLEVFRRFARIVNEGNPPR
jgi:GMP synthase (glutamine-hydrolysing)